MAVYYMDATAGVDANSGTSEAQAWQTLTKLGTVTLNAGDEVRFKNGEVFRGASYGVRASGLGGSLIAPIIFRPYTLSDVLPVLDGGLVLTGWTAHATNIWKMTPGVEVNGISVDGAIKWFTAGHVSPVWLPTTQDPNTLDATRPWAYQNGVVYLYLEENPSGHTVVGCVRDIVDCNNVGGVEFRELQLSHAQDRAMRPRSSQNLATLAPVAIDGCTFILNGFRRSAGVISALNVIGLRITNCEITDNTNDALFADGCPYAEIDNNYIARLYRWESDGIQFQGHVRGPLGISCEGFDIHHNDIDFSGVDGEASSDSLKGAIICNGPIGSYGSIHHNDVQGGDFGINSGHSGVVIEDNVVHGQSGETWASGIYLGGDWEHQRDVVRRNIVYNATIGISITLKNFPKRKNLIAHNTVYDCATSGLQTLDQTSGAIVNNIIWCPNAISYLLRTDAVPASEALLIDHNLIGPEGLSKYARFHGSEAANLAAWRTLSSGDAHSTASDPMFVDPDSQNFELDQASPARGAARELIGAGQTHRNMGAL